MKTFQQLYAIERWDVWVSALMGTSPVKLAPPAEALRRLHFSWDRRSGYRVAPREHALYKEFGYYKPGASTLVADIGYQRPYMRPGLICPPYWTLGLGHSAPSPGSALTLYPVPGRPAVNRFGHTDVLARFDFRDMRVSTEVLALSDAMGLFRQVAEAMEQAREARQRLGG